MADPHLPRAGLFDGGSYGLSDDARAFLDEQDPRAAATARWLHELVLAADGDLAERVRPGWQGIVYRHPEGGYVCGLFPRGGEVRLLFEHGHRLNDDAGLLEGAGQTRSVTLTGPDPARAHALRALVREAVAERIFRPR